jgi:hypothetical protein
MSGSWVSETLPGIDLLRDLRPKGQMADRSVHNVGGLSDPLPSRSEHDGLVPNLKDKSAGGR